MLVGPGPLRELAALFGKLAIFLCGFHAGTTRRWNRPFRRQKSHAAGNPGFPLPASATHCLILMRLIVCAILAVRSMQASAAHRDNGFGLTVSFGSDEGEKGGGS